MKKLFGISSLVLGIIFALNTNAMAQNEFTVGGGLAYGTEVESIGIQGGATYSFTEEIRGAADLLIFFPDGFDWWELNFNGHYKFFSEDNINVYGLAGINYATLSFDSQFGGGSTSEVGLNLGGGADFGLDFANLYTELRFVLGDLDQLVLAAGLRFPI